MPGLPHSCAPRPAATWRRQLAAAGLLALLAVTPVACRKPPTSSPYDRAATVELQEYFQAARAGNHDLAARKLERLNALRPASEFVGFNLQHETESRLLDQVNAKLAQGQPAEALRLLDEEMARTIASARLKTAQRQLAALVAVTEYQRHLPFATAPAAALAVAALPDPGVLDNHPAYRAWFEQQRQLARRLATTERDRLLDHVLRQLDVATVTNVATCRLLLAQLQLLAPQHAVNRDWQGLLAGDAAVQRAPPREDHALDLAAALCLRFDGDLPPAWSQALAERPAVSFSGLYARLLADLRQGRLLAGLGLTRDFPRELPAYDAAPVRRLLRAQLARQPVPEPTVGVPALLELLYFTEALDHTE